MYSYQLISFFLFIPLLFLVVFGCSDDSIDPEMILEDEKIILPIAYFETEEEAQAALTEVYDILTFQAVDGRFAPPQFVSDVMSDDSFAGGADAIDGQTYNGLNTFNVAPQEGFVSSIWRRNYWGVSRANGFMEKMDSAVVGDEYKAQSIAEAKFLRAYYYFELVRFFENVPLHTETIDSAENFYKTQNTPKEVYDQIALDLEESIVHLPEVIPSSENDGVSKWAAVSLLARVFLFYNDLYNVDLVAGNRILDRSAVLAYLEDLIDNSGHDLLPDYNDVFKLSSEFSLESVFEISHEDTGFSDWSAMHETKGNLAAQLLGPRVHESFSNYNRGWSFGTVSNKLATDLTNDPRYDATILDEAELDGDFVKGYQHTGFFSQKYSSDTEHTGTNGQFELNRTCNYRVIRFSDVLLMAAELGSGSGQAYLDKVRDRVGLPSVPVSEDNIFNERRLELSLEGHRYFDVVRKGLAVQEFSVSNDIGSLYTEADAVYDVTFGSSIFLPIPQEEIDASNGNFIQNDGY